MIVQLFLPILERTIMSGELKKNHLCFVKCFQGIRSFWRGVTASYWGAGETVIFFVIYEQLKKQREIQAQLQRQSGTSDRGDTSFNILDFGGTALCSGAAKLTATCIAYPHG